MDLLQLCVDGMHKILIYPTWVCASQFAQTDERFGFVSMVTQELKEAINRDVTLPDDYKMPASLKHISKSSKLCIAPQPFSTKEEVKLFNNAKSCYDRILYFAIYVSMRRVGVPKSAIINMLGTLRGMKHKIRTAYGDSEEAYGREEEDDQHGGSQGNGAGPAIWCW